MNTTVDNTHLEAHLYALAARYECLDREKARLSRATSQKERVFRAVQVVAAEKEIEDIKQIPSVALYLIESLEGLEDMTDADLLADLFAE